MVTFMLRFLNLMSVFDFPMRVNFGLIVLMCGFSMRVKVVLVMIVVVICCMVLVNNLMFVFDVTVSVCLFFRVGMGGVRVGVVDQG